MAPQLRDDHHAPDSTDPDATDGIARLLAEDIIAVGTLARELDRDAATVVRWCLTGTLGPAVNGVRTRVQLEHLRLGGGLVTTRQAFRRYVAALTVPGTVTAAPTTPTAGRTPAQRRRQSEAAARAAERLGC